jgi:modification methylase
MQRIGRIESVWTIAELQNEPKAPKAQPRVAFGTLVERGLVKPGTQLIRPSPRSAGANQSQSARRRLGQVGGREKAAPSGSIHKMGAAAQGAPSCNGWTYWHYKDGDRLVPIDNLRQKVRDEG